MNIQYILIALTCLVLSLDSAAMRARGGRARVGSGPALQVQNTGTKQPTVKPVSKPDSKPNLDHQNKWNKPGYKPGYNPWHRPNYWRRPVYAPVFVDYSGYDYYPDYYSTDTDSGSTSSERLSINPDSSSLNYQDQHYYQNYHADSQVPSSTNWSGY